MKNVDNRRTKEKRDNLDTHKKELLKNYEKKVRENCVITLMIIKKGNGKMLITGGKKNSVTTLILMKRDC